MNLWFVKPRENELLSSWLIRTAIAHGCTPLTLTNLIWKRWRVWTIDLDLAITSNKLDILRLSTGQNILINDLTLKQVNKKINGDSLYKKWITKIGVRNLDRTGGLRFCPLCLNKSPYLKKTWRLAWNIYCEDHKVLLQTTCCNCSLPFTPHKISYNQLSMIHCVRCNYSLVSQVYPLKDNDILDIQKYLNQMIFLNSDYTCNQIKEKFEIYHFFIRFFNRAYYFKSKPDQLLMESLDVDISNNNNNVSTIEMMPPEHLIKLMKIISLVKDKSADELAECFYSFGYTRQSFSSRLTFSKLLFIQNFLDCLPDKPRSTKRKRQIIRNEFHPLSKDKVMKKWHLLKMKS